MWMLNTLSVSVGVPRLAIAHSSPAKRTKAKGGIEAPHRSSQLVQQFVLLVLDLREEFVLRIAVAEPLSQYFWTR